VGPGSDRSGNDSGATRAHVFNLGHGVLPESDPGILAAVVELVHADASDGRGGATEGALR
jgi:uroporphyrinogen-III decarboxylase